MKINKLLALSLCFLLVGLSGCRQSEEETPENIEEAKALEEGDYGATLPFLSSDSRQQHQLRSRSLVDSMYIGTGLLNYAKDHFSTDLYTIQEGQFLAYDELASLLGRERDNNPDGLNPASDAQFDTGNGVVTGPVLVRDIYETDFIRDKEAKGVALAIALNGNVGDDNTVVSDSQLLAFGEEAARKLVTYMRKMPEIGDSMPIYVALYKTTGTESTLPGAFFSEAFFEGRSANFSSINEQWVMFPSDTANKLDGTTSTQFAMVKKALLGFLPDDVNIIGKGKFTDNTLSELHINVSMYAKTATEALSLTQYLKSQLSNFSSYDYKIVVEVKCQDETIATMVRPAGDKEVNVNSLL